MDKNLKKNLLWLMLAHSNDFLFMSCLFAANSYKKPSRPCPYCKTLQAQLKRHIMRKHKNEDLVKQMLKMVPKEQELIMDKIRKEGIYQTNMEKMKQDNPNLMRERNQGKNDLLVCTICKAFIAKRYYGRHCQQFHKVVKSDTEMKTPVPVSSLIKDSDDPEYFQEEILSRFRDTEQGKLCQTDKFIKAVGKFNFDIQRKDPTKASLARKDAMSDMNTLSSLFLVFKDLAAKQMETITVSPKDMLNHQYFDIRTRDETGKLKHGLKLNIQNLLKTSCKVMKGHYLIKDEMQMKTGIENFEAVFRLREPDIFGDALYTVKHRRQEVLRRPASLPDENIVQTIRDFIVGKLKEHDDEFDMWDRKKFNEVRNLLVGRITLFNARRGGEPSRLTLKEWEQADKGVWLTGNNAPDTTNEKTMQLLKSLKIAYQGGKGLKLVPCLIPQECHRLLRHIASAEVRSDSGVHPQNIFLFPSTKNSKDPVNGWYCIEEICKAANLPNALNATEIRHRASTLFSTKDASEPEREAFFEHMGHSETVNKNIYQTPKAVREVYQIGSFFYSIDDKKSGNA